MVDAMQKVNSRNCSKSSASGAWLVVYACVAMVFAGSGACRPEPGTARAAAESFLDAHYVRIDLQASLAQTDGVAGEKVRKEIELTAGVEAPEAAAKPRINYKQISVREKPGSASFVYELTISPQGSEPFTREAMLTVRRTDGGWKVFNFSEN